MPPNLNLFDATRNTRKQAFNIYDLRVGVAPKPHATRPDWQHAPHLTRLYSPGYLDDFDTPESTVAWPTECRKTC